MRELLSKRIVAKPWGRADVGPFASLPSIDRTAGADRIGEVWFEPGSGSVLAKYLFTSQRLSIQVHPDDAQAGVTLGARGKDECWLILNADAGAHYGIGLTRTVTREELKRAACDGSIVELLDWRRARAGDFIFNPANTIHALGPGLTVLEVQQNSDITLRLFDYGSDRTLHVEDAVAIALLTPHHHPLDTHIDFACSQILVNGPKFGLAFCNEHVPRLPENAHAIHLVTWLDEIRVGSQIVPPASMIPLRRPDEVRAISKQKFFIVWEAGRDA
jgi:mannose-6-phosphate isomerase